MPQRVYRGQRTILENLFSPSTVGSMYQPQVIRVEGKCFYLLSHLSSQSFVS